MSTRHLSDEEIAIIERLSPEALRLFIKQNDPGLKIDRDDAEELRKRLLKAPTEELFENLKSASLMEVEGIVDRQLQERLSRVKKEWQELKEAESHIASQQRYISKGQALLMTIISAGSILAAVVGWQAQSQLNDQKNEVKTLETRLKDDAEKFKLSSASNAQSLLKGKEHVRATLRALLESQSARIDDSLHEVLEQLQRLFVDSDTRDALARDLEYSKSLHRVLQDSGVSADPNETDDRWRRREKKIQLTWRFAECLQSLSNQNPEMDQLYTLERLWESFHRDLKTIPKEDFRDQEKDLHSLEQMLAYTEQVLGNIHLARWQITKRDSDLTTALECFSRAKDCYPGFGKAWNNKGVAHTYMALHNESDRFAHLEQAADAFINAEKVHQNERLKTSSTLNKASVMLLQSLFLAEESKSDEAYQLTNQAKEIVRQVELRHRGSQLLQTNAEIAIMQYIIDSGRLKGKEMGAARLKDVEAALWDAGVALEDITRKKFQQRDDWLILRKAVDRNLVTREKLYELLGLEEQL
jgi:hypothetical protein